MSAALHRKDSPTGQPWKLIWSNSFKMNDLVRRRFLPTTASRPGFWTTPLSMKPLLDWTMTVTVVKVAESQRGRCTMLLFVRTLYLLATID